MLETISEAAPPASLVHGPLTAAFIDPLGSMPDHLMAWLGNEGVRTAVWNNADTFLGDPTNLDSIPKDAAQNECEIFR